MPEFKIEDGGNIETGVGQFSLVLSSYVPIGITRVSGVDYLGQSNKEQPPGLCGAPNQVELRFQANHRGTATIVLNQSGRSYETNLPVDEKEIVVKVLVA